MCVCLNFDMLSNRVNTILGWATTPDALIDFVRTFRTDTVEEIE